MRIITVISLLFLASCAQYAGINYGELVDPNGRHWVIAGGKDETNVKFDLTMPDGTAAHYESEKADASTALKAASEASAAWAGVANKLIERIPTVP